VFKKDALISFEFFEIAFPVKICQNGLRFVEVVNDQVGNGLSGFYIEDGNFLGGNYLKKKQSNKYTYPKNINLKLHLKLRVTLAF
jgi:hypothetical protein